MQRVRMRGTYSTALAKLLLDHGFNIVQPSVTIKERFKLTDTDLDKPPDLDIHDAPDRQGVYATGENASLETLISVLQSTLDDAIIRRRRKSLRTGYRLVTVDPTVPYSINKDGRGIQSGYEMGSLNIEFPAMSKKTLDALRSQVTPTIEGHHHLKACGGRISHLLDMAEKMLEKGAPRGEVEKLLAESIRPEYPNLESRIDIEHVKIDGRIFYLGNAKIVEFDEEKRSLQLLRAFRRSGIYDGLRVHKDVNDYAVTDLRIGDWTFRTRYFSSNGQYKGTYINLNTPIELHPEKIRYVDLEVDVCLFPDGNTEKLDLDKLEDKVSEGYISERLSYIVKRKLEEITSSLRFDLQENKGSDVLG